MPRTFAEGHQGDRSSGGHGEAQQSLIHTASASSEISPAASARKTPTTSASGAPKLTPFKPKGDHREESGAFVAINEGMVLSDPVGIACSQSCRRCRIIGPLIPRSIQRRIQKSEVANPASATKLFKVPGMDRRYEFSREPNRFDHFASSVRALR